jgi:hypothetical protein
VSQSRSNKAQPVGDQLTDKLDHDSKLQVGLYSMRFGFALTFVSAPTSVVYGPSDEPLRRDLLIGR